MNLEELISQSEQVINQYNVALSSPRKNSKATALEEYKAWSAVYLPHLLRAVKDLKDELDEFKLSP